MNELLPNINEDNSTRASLELLYDISRELSSGPRFADVIGARPVFIHAKCWSNQRIDYCFG